MITELKIILEITNVLTKLISKYSSSKKESDIMNKLLLMELQANIRSFENAKKAGKVNYDKLVSQLKVTEIMNGIKQGHDFKSMRKGTVQQADVVEKRNNRYVGENMEYLFEGIRKKIGDLKDLKKHYSTFEKVPKSNVTLKFSNLFFQMKLIVDFLEDK